ncbi:MAG TPA: hypothetical protein DEQ02_10910, partial [Ruminococcaceae bacterium]|nr:hypothetical protein [Oscillospiraceae bacterium]
MNYDENRAETQPGGNPPQTNTNNYAYPAHGEPLMPAPRNYPAHAEISPQPAQINPPYGGGMFSAPRAPYPPPATVNPYPPPAAVNPYPQAPAYAYPAPGYYYAPPVDPVTLEKKEVRKTSNRVGLAFVLSMVLVFVITFIVEIVLIASTGDIYAINNFLNDSNFLMIFQIAASVPAFTLPFLLVAKVSGHKIGALMPTDKVKPPLMAALVGLS